MPPLVKFAIVRQINLWDDAEQSPAMDHQAAIVELPGRAQRRAGDKDREELAARRDQPADLALDRVEQRVLKQKIVDRIGGKAELRKHHQPDARLGAGGEQRQDVVGIAPRLADRNRRHACAEPQKLVAVRGKERGHRGRGSRSAGSISIWGPLAAE